MIRMQNHVVFTKGSLVMVMLGMVCVYCLLAIDTQ